MKAFDAFSEPSQFVIVRHITSNAYDWESRKFASTLEEAEADATEMAETRAGRVMVFQLVGVTKEQTPRITLEMLDTESADDDAGKEETDD